MTRSELIEKLAQKMKMTWQRAEFVVQAIFGRMEESLRRGERIEVRGFGTFEVRSYKGYAGRNPRTGNVVEVAPKRLPFFKVSKSLAARIDGGRDRKPAIVPDQDTRPERASNTPGLAPHQVR